MVTVDQGRRIGLGTVSFSSRSHRRRSSTRIAYSNMVRSKYSKIGSLSLEPITKLRERIDRREKNYVREKREVGVGNKHGKKG